MTGRLRELAERWKGVPNVYGSAEETYRECADELISILDAEGGGGTPLPGVVWNERTNAAHLIKRGTEVEFCAEYGCCRVFTHPARSGVVSDEDVQDLVSKAMRRAWSLGQTYWQQADSESWNQQDKSADTQRKFDALIEETLAAIQGERHE